MTGNDLLATLSNTPIARQLGVPTVPALRRHRPGDPLLAGPVLVASAGTGRFATPVAAFVEEHGQPAVSEPAEETLHGVVVDLSGATTLADLAAAQQILTPAVRRLGPSGRLLLIGAEPAEAVASAGAEAAAVAQGLDGLVRSIGKELRAGATANLLVAAEATPPAALDSSLRFFLSARSAYVDGQVVHVGTPVGTPQEPAEVDDPRAEERPLAGRTAVVTGAARGIGAAVADTLARDGATIVAVDVPAAGEGLAATANRTGGTALQLDITADDAPERLLRHLAERHGGVDLVVHNAGITRDKLLANMTEDRWNAVLAVNLGAQLRINEALLAAGSPLHDAGRIVCVSSQSGIAGNRGQTNYAASKAGVIGMVRALAPRFAGRGATINAVAPGFIETEMTQTMPLGTREAGRRVNSLRQGGLPVDVAETIGWLGRAESGGLNGQVVRVCGQSMLGA
ncbi:3-oxoacyl-[acyl-carrier protein] reductase [Pseudonocardia ammonioxydans]|uniref:3-oxoacyl-[acyl-carrier protein] reductase n=1 Tax=Pseudonocardia ammonioxydans TaxID=260086 RepID=A0A1I5ERR1_PSUAM|nr:3-oxoacyl-ACP reductase [Pseudonocardia ammonioxydans]SFO14119.1 3-oxoacyl-[acyl-carrier protein] reductase [Pseudonocardia ammonioxydans]